MFDWQQFVFESVLTEDPSKKTLRLLGHFAGKPEDQASFFLASDSHSLQ